MELLVYSKPDCPLCEHAAVEIQLAGLMEYIQGVNIETDPELMARYEMRIPVIHNPKTGIELGWPFTADELSKVFKIHP